VVGVNAHSTCRLGIARQHVPYLNASEISRSHSCPWVALTHGLGWVGLGRDFQSLVLGWVHYSKSTKHFFEELVLSDIL